MAFSNFIEPKPLLSCERKKREVLSCAIDLSPPHGAREMAQRPLI